MDHLVNLVLTIVKAHDIMRRGPGRGVCYITGLFKHYSQYRCHTFKIYFVYI